MSLLYTAKGLFYNGDDYGDRPEQMVQFWL